MRVYVIHDPADEELARRLAKDLKGKGHEALVAADFRSKGEKAVEEAIASCDKSIVLMTSNLAKTMKRESKSPSLSIDIIVKDEITEVAA